jgi:hypothetical protein
VSARDKLWQRLFAAELGLDQPAFVAVSGAGAVAEVVAAGSGPFVLKPRFGSNGCAVARVTHTAAGFALESDCPDTARFLDEFPFDPTARGRDALEALAGRRERYIDRARAAIPERLLNESLLEPEVPPWRADGFVCEPRAIAQRVSGERFDVLGGLCKLVGTAVGACVARDFREVPLLAGLEPHLGTDAPRACAELLAAAERAATALVPALEPLGTRVHQFGIDFRLYRSAEGAPRFALLEFQFGIGAVAPECAPPGYRTRAELVRTFGPESG